MTEAVDDPASPQTPGAITAAVLGRPISVLKQRGEADRQAGGTRTLVTVHPSYLLRLPDPDAQYAAFL